MPTPTCDRFEAECLNFTQTGEASNEFLSHLDNCEHCARVVNDTFNRQAQAFEEFVADIRQSLEGE